MKEYLNKLTEYFIREHKIDENTKYEIFDIEAKELLNSNRLDLIVKLEYIDSREKGLNNEYIKNVYKKHIEAFSEGMYIEPGKENEKNNIDVFFEDFDKTIESIKKNGFDDSISIIPIGKNNVILDGAHRVASAIYFNKKVKVIKFENIEFNADYNFFQERLLENDIIEYLILKYTKYKENTFVFCLWPAAEGKEKREEAEKIITQRTNIIYKKSIKLTYEGFRNFMIQIYRKFEWIGDYKNNFKGVFGQLDNCYKEGKDLEIFVVEADNLDIILETKKKVRDLFNIGNFSIHSTDNQLETIHMLNLLLNENSIHFLNNGEPDKFSEFNKKLEIFISKIKEEQLNFDDFVIDSSSVLALYGLREVNDIDFISVSNKYKNIECDGIENHHDYVCLYDKSINEIIFNPNNYLHYNEVKFITLDNLRKMKQNRNESKDKEDIKLIDSLISSDVKKLKFLKFKNKLQRIRRNIKIRIKEMLRAILIKLKLFDFAKKVLSKIRGE